MGRFVAFLGVLVLTGGGLPMIVAAQSAPGGDSRHESYYYPPISSRETYVSRASVQPDVDRVGRLGFVTGLTEAQMSRPYAPPFVVFAKGGDADRLIIVSVGGSGFQGIYQARAVLAQLTSIARNSQLLRSLKVEDIFTFLDVARMLGFSDVTISDGQSFTHQIKLK